jgi:hypothetical protein
MFKGTELKGGLALFDVFGPFLAFFGHFWPFFGHFWGILTPLWPPTHLFLTSLWPLCGLSKALAATPLRNWGLSREFLGVKGGFKIGSKRGVKKGQKRVKKGCFCWLLTLFWPFLALFWPFLAFFGPFLAFPSRGYPSKEPKKGSKTRFFDQKKALFLRDFP